MSLRKRENTRKLYEEAVDLIKVKQNVLKVTVKKQQCIYRVSQEECARLREGVPYVKV